MVLSLDRLLDKRYDDQVRRRYRARRHLSVALWSCAVISGLVALATLNMEGEFLGPLFAVLAALVGLVSVTIALTATIKRRAEYRTFASLLADASPAIVARSPWTADDAITFVHAWNDFEADAALALDRANADFDKLSPPSLLPALRAANLLDEVDVRRLRVLIRLRNSIVYGTPTAVPPAASTLLDRITSRLGEHAGVSAGPHGGARPSPA